MITIILRIITAVIIMAMLLLLLLQRGAGLGKLLTQDPVRQALLWGCPSSFAGPSQARVPAQRFHDHCRQRCPERVHAVWHTSHLPVPARQRRQALADPRRDPSHPCPHAAPCFLPKFAFFKGEVLKRVLASRAHHNDSKAWTELLMLPQCVLGAPPRAGRRHRRAAAAHILDLG